MQEDTQTIAARGRDAPAGAGRPFYRYPPFRARAGLGRSVLPPDGQTRTENGVRNRKRANNVEMYV